MPKRNSHKTRYRKSGLCMLLQRYSRKYEIHLSAQECFAGRKYFLKKRMMMTIKTRLKSKLGSITKIRFCENNSFSRKYSETIIRRSSAIKMVSFFITKRKAASSSRSLSIDNVLGYNTGLVFSWICFWLRPHILHLDQG